MKRETVLQAAVVAVADGGTAASAKGVDPSDQRRCKLCDEVKSHDNFCIASGGWHAWYCSDCRINYIRKGFRLGLKIDDIREAYSVRFAMPSPPRLCFRVQLDTVTVHCSPDIVNLAVLVATTLASGHRTPCSRVTAGA